jgi:hypothetical protein
MARTDLRERDVPYLAAFPLEVPLLAIHGPFTPPLVWDPEVGLHTPETGTDYGCWWAVTDAGDVAVPVAVVEEMHAATGTGCAWQIDLRGAVTEEDKHTHWVREWDRIRGDLNAAAQRVTDRVST